MRLNTSTLSPPTNTATALVVVCAHAVISAERVNDFETVAFGL